MSTVNIWRLVAVLSLAPSGFSPSPVAQRFAPVAHGFSPALAPDRVLFIGNSLTMANDLTSTVESLSADAGSRRLECRAVAFPNYSLEDHWNRGDAGRAIAAGGWSTVV